MYRIGYFLILLISWLPFWMLQAIADFMAWSLYLLGYRKDVVLNNLKNSFPEKSEREVRSIARKFYRNFADTIMLSFKNFSISEAEMKKRCSVNNIDVVQRHLREGRNVIAMLPHYSNWEWNIAMPMFLDKDINAYTVYQPLNSTFFNEKIQGSRSRFGLELVPMRQTYKVCLSKENNGKHIFGLVADQSPHRRSLKRWLTFMNQDTPVHVGSENIAREKDYAVVFLYSRMVKRGYYELTFEQMYDRGGATAEGEITSRFFEKLEILLKERPEEYLWSHKRWKHKRKQEV